ncbi:MAG: ABC transporter ATP-binding protein [Chitinivibrionales bacterium]
MSKVVFKEVFKTYKKGFTGKRVEAVRGLSFSISGDGITGFIGPNGAGKTTSIKMLLGLISPTGGEILINNTPASEPGVKRNIAFVSEQPYFYSHLSCRETLRFSAHLYGIKITEKRIEESLERVGLKEKMDLRVRQLSKGMQQRLSIANALISDAGLFVMDEPMSGLDPLGRKLFKQLFRELNSEGKKVFFSTHILDDIEDLCSDIIVLAEGRLVQSGSISSILEQGKTGTDIKVRGHLPDMNRVSPDCSIHKSVQGYSIIFLPKGNSLQKVLEFLASNEIYPESVVPRVLSLEDLLYNN